MQNKKLLIKNGLVIDPANKVKTKLDVLVEDGKIKKLGKKLEADDAEIIDAKNKIVIPGIIDMHTHLRVPGWGSVAAETRAAAKGGVTTMVAMPNTDPIADSPSVIKHVYARVKEEAVVNVYQAGSITKGGTKLAEMLKLKKAGALLFSDDGADVEDVDLMFLAMQYAKSHDLLLLCHCEDHNLSANGALHEGWVSTQLGLPGIPATAEEEAVTRNIA
ncbi:MAG TPA: dihydroorotase, partial [Candidatus Peregrinibacteria bacterium]|nr:dihydroorotase [Candidatus Peregrinibacteria bacterium]